MADKSRRSSAPSPALKRKLEELQQNIAALEKSVLSKKRRLARLRQQQQLRQQVSGQTPVVEPAVTRRELPPCRSLPLRQELMAGALQVWDFIFTFGQQLRLAPLELEDLVDLLRFSGRDSAPLAEVFCALLRLLLSDPRVASSLASAIPPHLNFAARVRGTNDAGCVTGDRFNGLRLMPTKLKPELVQPLTWQAVLRTVLPRLQVFQELAAHSCFGDASAPGLRDRLQALLVQGEEAARSRAVLERDGRLGFSCLPERLLEDLLSAAASLESQEMHALPLPEKLAALRLLCLSCYDTGAVKELLERNCEERVHRLVAAERTARERAQTRPRQPISGRRLELLEQLRSCQAVSLKKAKTKGKKSPSQPSPAELAEAEQQVEAIEAAGVEIIVPQVPAELFQDDSDGIPEELLDARQKAQLRHARSRAGGARKRRALSSVAVAQAEETIRLALESKEDRAIRAAVKYGRAAGLLGEAPDGGVYCTATMAAALIRQSEADLREKAAAEARELERGLAQCFMRTEPLGTDAAHRRYWVFEHSSALFVECWDLPPSAAADKVSGMVPPSRRESAWRVYRGARELWAVCDALSPADADLQGGLKALFRLKDRPPALSESGHEWLGRSVRREFGRGRNLRVAVGTIVGWLPAEGKERALWHVVHSDGDEEDLDEFEVANSLLPDAGDCNDAETPDSGVPQVVNCYTNTLRGALGIKDFHIGIPGLRSELLQLSSVLAAGLKSKGGGFLKEQKRAWEQSVRAASAVEELRESLLSLEAVVRAVQEIPDLRDEVSNSSTGRCD